MNNTLFPYTEKNNDINDVTGFDCPGISLKVIVNSMIGHLTGTIAKNKIGIENRVLQDLKLYTDQSKIAPVIYEMLATVISNARNTSVCITAEKFMNIITLNVEDRNNYNGYALSFSLMAIEMQARMAGGDISINGAQKRIATVSLSFPDISAIQHSVYE